MSRLDEITERLQAITVELGLQELDDERSAQLTREAAALSAEASQEVERALREASQDE